VRILAIDGGGIRGLIPAVVLAELERRTGRRIAELFDLVAGTSTGGILACGLTRPADAGGAAYTAADLIGLYESEGPAIFNRALAVRGGSGDGGRGERYDDAGLNAALHRYLGASTLSQTLTDVLITAYEIERREVFLFRSSRARDDPAHDFTLMDAARATAAAPTYFVPARVRDVAGAATWALIDGGVFAANPALLAVAEARASGSSDVVDIVVSLGTGAPTRRLALEEARAWTRSDWARPMLDVVLDGGSESVDSALGRLLPDGRYVRLQTRLDEAADDLDDAGDRNLEALRRTGARLVEERSDDLDRIAAAVTA
jgi:predicted acylesterase/phospholipase RssA